MTSDILIRPETPDDATAIAALHRDAFGPDHVAPALVDRLRHLDAPLPTCGFVACTASDDLVGHVMLSHNWLDAPARLVDVLVLSPLGVAKRAQRRGVGTALLRRAGEEAGRTGAPLLFLEGSPAYYGARGFEASKPLGLRAPSLRIPEAALQVARLPVYEPGMTGTLVYRELWWDLDCVRLRQARHLMPGAKAGS